MGDLHQIEMMLSVIMNDLIQTREGAGAGAIEGRIQSKVKLCLP